MVQLGQYALFAALLLSAYGMFAAVFGGMRKNLPFIRSAENSAIAAFVMTGVSSVCLWYFFMTDYFRVEYVAQYSARNMPDIYKFSAFWGGQKGSLLLWALVLAFFAAVVVVQNRHRHRAVMPYVTAVLQGTLLFFLVLLQFVTNPFDVLPGTPIDGQGLNPLLQNPYMMTHPPVLYLGYIGLTVPFAFALAALMSGKLDASWARTTRIWAMIAWVFLTFGIALGGMWAYEELGWGGYWAWDPVENASLMPWLILTAFLHSIMITEKKGMLKIWNFLLIIMAFQLSIFGTFITRSGVISSVHSFALSNLGPLFIIFLGTSTAFSLYWVAYRAPELRSELRMRSFLSREASFLLNNWIFVSICFAVFWGTVFPIVSEWATGEQISVAAPFFNAVSLPLGLALLLLTGICPLIAWRKASGKNFRRNFLYPLLGGALTGAVLVALGVRDLVPVVFFSSSSFVMITIFFEFYKGARARQNIKESGFWTAVADLTLMNKRRYGGFIIHAGVVVMFIGIIGSSWYQLEGDFTVKSGESFTLGDYTVRFQGLQQRRDPEKDVVTAPVDVFKKGRQITVLYPEKHFHHKSDQPMTEVAVRTTPKEDLYLILAAWNEQGDVTFHAFVNPLVQLVWIGIAIMVLAGIFVLFPDKKGVARARAEKSEEAVEHEAA
jgi:cytochrome c-type biogenesis protein CcmF